MTSKDSWDEATDLAGMAATGDQAALARIIALTQRDIRRYTASHVNPTEADDLTQETFLRAIRTLPQFQGRSSLRTWLLVIARRTVIDHLRRRSTRPQLSPRDDWQTVAEGAQPVSGDFTETVVMELMLAGLTTERREALILTQVLGLSYQEAAEICLCPIGTIRSRVARAREDLIRMASEERPIKRADGQ